MLHAYAPTIAIGRTLRLALVVAVAMLVVCLPAADAQTPVSQATPADGSTASHPAHIHAGTCDELGDVAIPLENIAAQFGGESVGLSSARAVLSSQTFVDVPLDEIVAGDHAINVHLSDEEMGTYIACGDIGGVLLENEDGGNDLIIGLGEMNDSGYSGVAWLGEDGERTEVYIMLIQSGELD